MDFENELDNNFLHAASASGLPYRSVHQPQGTDNAYEHRQHALFADHYDGDADYLPSLSPELEVDGEGSIFTDADATPGPSSAAAKPRRPRSKPGKQAEPLPGWIGPNPPCPECPSKKSFKPTAFNLGQVCNKHMRKRLKENRSRNNFQVSLEAGWQARDKYDMVYPTFPPLDWDGEGKDDFDHFLSDEAEAYAVKMFIDAANTVYNDTKKPNEDALEEEVRLHQNFLKQQKDYNHKPHEEASKDFYTNAWIVARMRLLFAAVLTYHRGGKSVYPIGGSNNGYGEDRITKMSARLKKIAEILKRDKRVVMDVIEGRGVAALAMHPFKFEERKASNFKCNAKKKRKMEGEESDDEDATPVPAGDEGGVVEGEADRPDNAMPAPVPKKRRQPAKKRKTVNADTEQAHGLPVVNEQHDWTTYNDPSPYVFQGASMVPSMVTESYHPPPDYGLYSSAAAADMTSVPFLNQPAIPPNAAPIPFENDYFGPAFGIPQGDGLFSQFDFDNEAGTDQSTFDVDDLFARLTNEVSGMQAPPAIPPHQEATADDPYPGYAPVLPVRPKQ